jgi:hypothetical protein
MKGGQITPKGMIDRMKQMGDGGGGAAGGGKPGEAGAREREVLAWVEANAPDAVTPWTPVTLPDGTKAEVGGLDPFIERNPPVSVLKPDLAAHSEEVIELAGKLAEVEIRSLDVTDLGGGVYRVRAVAGNKGYFATHTKQAARARVHLPVAWCWRREEGGAGQAIRPSPDRPRSSGTMQGDGWSRHPLDRAVSVTSGNAGGDHKTFTVKKGPDQ